MLTLMNCFNGKILYRSGTFCLLSILFWLQRNQNFIGQFELIKGTQLLEQYDKLSFATYRCVRLMTLYSP